MKSKNVYWHICLFYLILYIPANIFSVMSGWVFLGLTSTKQRTKCLAQGHNAVPPVSLQSATSRSRVKHSTIEPPRSLYWQQILYQFGLVRFFTSQSTAMVMLGRSVHLTTLFSWASLTKRLASISITYFRLYLTTTLLESAEGRRMAGEIIL